MSGSKLVPVFAQQLEAEGRRDRVDTPGLGLRLEAAHDQAADLFLVVDEAVGVAHHGQHRVDAVDAVGDDVEVLGRPERHRHASELAELARPLAGAVDERVAGDLELAAVVAHANARDAARVALALGLHADHLDAFDDRRASLARALGQRHRQVGRIGLAVAGNPDRALQVVGAHHRKQLASALRADLLAVDAEAAGEGELAAQHLHALRRARDVDAAALLPSGRQAGLRFERCIELDAVLAHPRHVAVGTHLADQAGGVPGRATGELALLEQQHVLLAEPGEVVTPSSSRRCRRQPRRCALRSAGASRQARRSAITPATIAPVPSARCNRKRSFSSSTPISAANSTEVSRRAATDATGARVIAQSAMP